VGSYLAFVFEKLKTTVEISNPEENGNECDKYPYSFYQHKSKCSIEL
jgi:hypothetical protein